MPEFDELTAAYRNAFSGPSGRAVARHLLQNYVLEEEPTMEPLIVSYNAGMRAVVLRIIRRAGLIEEVRNCV